MTFIVRWRSIPDVDIQHFCWYFLLVFIIFEMDTNKEDTSMPKSSFGLNDTFLRNLKSQEQTKISDGGGLFIYLSPNGTKLWRMAYRFGGKQKLLSFGA